MKIIFTKDSLLFPDFHCNECRGSYSKVIELGPEKLFFCQSCIDLAYHKFRDKFDKVDKKDSERITLSPFIYKVDMFHAIVKDMQLAGIIDEKRLKEYTDVICQITS